MLATLLQAAAGKAKPFPALFVTQSGSLDVYSLTDGDDPAEIVLDNVLTDSDIHASEAAAIDAANGILYLFARASTKLTAVDISDPNAPEVLGALTDATNFVTGSDARSSLAIASDGNHVFVSGGDRGEVYAVDVSDPASMSVVGTFSNANLTISEGMAVAGSVLYLSSFNDWFFKINISDPTAMTVSSSADIGRRGRYMAIDSANNLAIMFGAGDNCTTVDVSGTPSLADNFSSQVLIGAADIAGRRLLTLSNITSNDYAYTYSVAGNETLSGTYNLLLPKEAAPIYDSVLDYVFTVKNDNQLAAIDFSDEAAVTVAGTLSTGKSYGGGIAIYRPE